MKNTHFVFGCLLFMTLSLATGIVSQTQEEFPFDNYPDFRAHLGKIFQEKKIEEAVRLLKIALEKFPENLEANAYNLAFMSGQVQDYETGVKALQYAHEKDVWFGKYVFDADMWKPFKERPDFQQFLTENEGRRVAAQKQSESLLEVLVPEDFQKDKIYPLFIALHGGGGNIADFKPSWTSPKMKEQFIVAYVQSSLKISMNGFNWTEDMEISKREITQAYKKVVKAYPVDKERIIVGGFSSGGVASLEIVLQDILPVRGFIVLCPAKPDSFTLKNVKGAKARGIKGTLLTTEMDTRLDNQKEMAEIFRDQEFPCEFIVTPNIGHWFPEDLDQKIDTAIEKIFLKE